jgi:gamma-glutamyltranspeptidase/glutathione hydrolase
MLQTLRSNRGMVTSSHHLAAEAGLRCLRDGGNAIEAMVAAAATISVVYPHMNGLGGDGFWLISEPGRRTPRAINGVGAAGGGVDVDLYHRQGLEQIPSRGPLAANTVAGTISSWQAALEVSASWGGSMPLSRLLEDATYYAQAGFPVSDSQFHNTVAKHAELIDVPGWADTFLVGAEPPAIGALFKQPALATTFRQLATAGLDDFYRGELARSIGATTSNNAPSPPIRSACGCNAGMCTTRRHQHKGWRPYSFSGFSIALAVRRRTALSMFTAPSRR